MNVGVFKREIKVYWKGLIFWLVGIAFLIWSSVVKYDTMQTAGQSVTELVKQFPVSVQTIFGLTGFDLTKKSGFFGVMFMYVALMATVHAVMLGAGIIAKEERDRTSEFLYAKPATRRAIITAKIIAGLANIFVFNIATLLSSIIFFSASFSLNDDFSRDILLLMLGLGILQIMFFFIGTAIAAISHRPKLSASIASGVLLLMFIVTYLINLDSNLDFLKYVTPFKYFDAKDVLATGQLDIFYIILSLIIILTSAFVTYRAYQARDLEV